MADKGQQTEKPTQRRLDKAREEGRFPVSRDLLAAAQFTLFVVLLLSYAPDWLDGSRRMTHALMRAAFETEITPRALVQLYGTFWRQVFVPMLTMGGLVVAFTVFSQLAMTRFGFSLNKLAPDLSRLSPLKKLRELPAQNLPQLMQAVLLLPVFCYAVYVVASREMGTILELPFMSIGAGTLAVALSLKGLLWRGAGALLVWGFVDFFRQQRRFNQQMLMSRQEIREEQKESDGNPQVKQRIRRIQRDLLRRKMMGDVKKATAVIVNPTHYAVAILYEPEQMAAPRVLAKGKNYLALRIRRKAMDHDVPIVENPPLAQALYKNVEVGQEIPAVLYKAVAEILAYIFRLTKRRL